MGLPLDNLVGMTTDGAPAMYGQKSGLVSRIQEEMPEEDTGELTAYHCIIHQEALCGKILPTEHVMSYIKQIVNLFRAKGLNHQQFKSLMEELDLEYRDLLYHTEVRWLSRGKVLSRFIEVRK